MNPVRAGFPSPAAEYIETALDPMDLLLPNPDSSFFGKVVGNSMEDVFVRNNDFIIVDKSIEPRSGNVVMCSLDGTFLTKILRVEGRKRTLVSGNPAYPPIAITSENEFQLWGVVSKSIHDLLLRGQGVRAR
ncbi:translesion error-prone DNA polymerase V autoproteolytic subunit [Leptospira barantonii]|uniref:Translesion error-prone DNA polymerase V autoproteolytic subunit n=1 Tax=Leptospira barantonii TaxID=2023184 RepID=A0A5F2BH35_9LEPT|nr:translesion error-prone DNA polymerase V autoproteolytic subunit [Leptospira barantonii]